MARATPRKPPVQREKIQQGFIVQLYETVGAKVYVLGTRRPGGSRCRKCGEFNPEHQGTCQTPGISDLIVFLPFPPGRDSFQQPTKVLLFHEAKAKDAHGRMNEMSDEQRELRELVLASCNEHVVGDLDAAIAFLLERGYLRADQVPHYRLPNTKGEHSDTASAVNSSRTRSATCAAGRSSTI
jgi:hypothetical protein